MTKGEVRAARKAAVASGRPWHIETSASGQLEIVRERTRAEEQRHQVRMHRWAQRSYDYDRD